MFLFSILDKAIQGKFLSFEEGLFLYEKAPLSGLMQAAHELRNRLTPPGIVTWIIDRNVNITNVCVSRCRFCNFHRLKGDADAYITSHEEYRQKIEELFSLGGNQLLLQGGMHPDLGVDFYIDLFRWLKKEFPSLRLHALGPPEIVYLARKEKKSFGEILSLLVEAGLDSLPGAGAEILSDRVRRFVSPGKCSSEEWLSVMREAHKMNLHTSATMMLGHYETPEERIRHLILLRQLQEEKPAHAPGFVAFIPWPFQHKGTRLYNEYGISNSITPAGYLRMVALSRLMLPNIRNIQASWLTVGMNIAQLCLHGGANDMGSIMIEENVVSAAGASFRTNIEEMQQTIREAGFIPKRRNQQYEIIE